MPRRCIESVQCPESAKKKKLIIEETPLDVSFYDDEALAPGIIFSDLQQNKWRIGKAIGQGSFGRIFLASDDIEKEVTKQNARYVAKIEPHTNGPLFVEIHCLIRTAIMSKVKSWRFQNKQKCLGMPIYIASGSFIDDNTGVKYRFLVLPRYDIDLQKIIAKTKVLDLKNVLVIAVQILNVLEYLHHQGYTHSDIKSSNLMIGFDGTKVGNFQKVKQPLSFQKDTKEVSVLSGKCRKVKSSHSRTTNYYDDEDFIVKDHKSTSGSNGEEEIDKKLATVKNKLQKLLSDRHSRTLHRHHAFNLRQMSNYVNYEDMSISSVCSDQSYQKLIDDFTHKYKNSDCERPNHGMGVKHEPEEIYREAILSQSNGQIYLLDYGLASKFLDSNGKHKEFGMDARKAHDGTLEYSSRDSHIGAHSRRSDLETLGYNILDWLTGSLPWKTSEVLADPDLVHALKKNFMSDCKSLLKTCFKTEFYPKFIEKYFQYITSLEFTEKPDYDFCRSLLKSELLKMNCDKDSNVNFDTIMLPMNHKRMCYPNKFLHKNTGPNFIAKNGIHKSYERENVYSFENDLKLELIKQTLNSSSDGVRKPCTSRNFFISDADLVTRLKKSLMPQDIFGKKLSPKNLRSNKKNIKSNQRKRTHKSSIGKFGNFMGSTKQFTWAEILAGNPEDIIRKERNPPAHIDDDEDNCRYRIRKLSNASLDSESSTQSQILDKDYLQDMNPTYAMKEVVENLKKKISNKPSRIDEKYRDEVEGFTPEMIKYYIIKKNREANEKLETVHQNNNKNIKENKVPVITKRITRSYKKKENKAPITDAKATGRAEKSTKSVMEVKSDKNTSRSLRSNTKVSTKKEVKIIGEPLEVPLVLQVSTKTSKEAKLKVVPNRRRLRSSKRKKC